MELPAQAQLLQGGVSCGGETVRLWTGAAVVGGGAAVFYQLPLRSTDPLAGLSFQGGGGTHTGKPVTEGQIVMENDRNGLPCSRWGHYIWGQVTVYLVS